LDWSAFCNLVAGGGGMKDEALKLAKECGATTYTNRHYPEATAVTFSPVAWEKFCEQALAAPVQPVAWAEYHYKKGRFTGLTTNDINAVDSVGDGCQWVPQLQALAQPAVQEPVAWHDKIKGMEVSMDVSTGDDDIDHRVYGQVYEVILAHEAGPDVILAIESERNFTTPPAQPAVPDVIHHTDLSEHPQYIEGWNDCRAEMLKGMKP